MEDDRHRPRASGLAERATALTGELAALGRRLGRARADAERARRLAAMSSQLNEALDEEEILRIVAAHVLELFPSDRVSVALLNDPPTSLTVHALEGSVAHVPQGTDVPVGNSAIGAAIQRGETVLVPDTANSPYDESRRLATGGIASTACVPLMIRRRAIGTLNVGSRELDRYDDDDRQRLEQTAALLASNLEVRRQIGRAQAALAQTQEHARRLAALSDLGQALSVATTEEEFMMAPGENGQASPS